MPRFQGWSMVYINFEQLRSTLSKTELFSGKACSLRSHNQLYVFVLAGEYALGAIGMTF